MELLMNTSKFDKKLLFILSPIIVIALSYLTVRLAGAFLGIWAWFPLALVLWGMFALMIFIERRTRKHPQAVGRSDRIKRLVNSGPFDWSNSFAIILTKLATFHLTLADSCVGRVCSDQCTIGGRVLARCVDGLHRQMAGLAQRAVFQFFFAINHPLTYGFYSLGNRHPITAISTFVMGVV
jgi:hypothetical protein